MRWNAWTARQARCHCGRQVQVATARHGIRKQHSPLMQSLNLLLFPPSLPALVTSKHTRAGLGNKHAVAVMQAVQDPTPVSPDTDAMTLQEQYGVTSTATGSQGQPPDSQTGETHASSPSHLTTLLTSAPSSSRLVALLDYNLHMVNPVHISAALVRAARLDSSRSRRSQLPAPHPHQPQQPSQQLVDLCTHLLLGTRWSDSSKHLLRAAQILSHQSATLDAAGSAAGLLASCGVRELANISWAIATLGADHGLIANAIINAIHQAAGASLEPRTSSSTHADTCDRATPASPGYETSPEADGLAGGDGWEVAGVGSGSRWVPSHTWIGRPVRRGRALDSRLAAAQPKALVNLLWALARWMPAPQATQSRGRNARPSSAAQQALAGQVDAGTLKLALEALCSALLRSIDRTSAQDVALATWSLGTLQFEPTSCALLPVIISTLPTISRQMQPQGLSMCIWGLSQLLGSTSELPGYVHQAVSAQTRHLSDQLAHQPQEVAMLMQGLGSLGNRDPSVWRTVQSKVAAAGVRHWPSGALAQLLNAYASAGRPCVELVSALHDWAFSQGKDAAALNLPTWRDADLTALIWAAATLYQKTLKSAGPQATAASQALIDASDTAANDSEPMYQLDASEDSLQEQEQVQEGGTAQHGSSSTTARVAGSTGRTAASSRAQGYASAVEQEVSAADLMSKVQQLVRAAVPHLTSRVLTGSLSPADVALSAWATTRCHVASTELLDACASHATAHLRQYKGKELVALLQSLSEFNSLPRAVEVPARPTEQHQHSRDSSATSPDQPSDVTTSQVTTNRLWAELKQQSHRVLPGLSHTQLACLCTSAVHAGQADAQLMTGVLQLVLGAVAIKARSLEQQSLARAGQALFTDVQLQPTDSGNRRKQGAARSTSSAAAAAAAAGPGESSLDAADAGWASIAVPPGSSSQQEGIDQLAIAQATGVNDDAATNSRQSPTSDQQLPSRSSSRTWRKPSSLSAAASATYHMPTPASLVIIMWALARAGFRSARLFQLSAVMCSSGGIHRLSPDQMHQLLWTLVSSKSYSGPLMTQLCAQLTKFVGSLEPAAVCDVLGLLAVSKHYDAKLVAGCCITLRPHMNRLAPDQLAVVMWAVASLNAGVMLQWRPPLHSLTRNMPHMCPHSIALTLVAVATQQHVLFGSARQPAAQPAPTPTLEQSDVHIPGSTPQGDARSGAAPHPARSRQAASTPVRNPLAAVAARQKVASQESFVLLEALLIQVQHMGRTDGFQDLVCASPEVGQLLGEGLALLAVSSRPAVRKAAQACMQALPPGVLALIQTCWLTAAMDGRLGQASQQPPAVQHVGPGSTSAVQWYTWHAAGSSSTGLKQVQKQLGRALQQLGFDVHMPAQPTPPPFVSGMPAPSTPGSSPAQPGAELAYSRGASGVLGEAGQEDEQVGYSNSRGSSGSSRKSMMPLSIPGLLLLPYAMPGPLAILIAPPTSFARNLPSELLGPLFVRVTLLGDMGWRPAVLDARTWAALRGNAQVLRFVRQLLQCWGVTLPVLPEEEDEEEEGEGDEEEEGHGLRAPLDNSIWTD